VGYQLFTIIFCTASIPERERLAREALTVSGVVSVRELMTGKENIHVVAIGRSSDDLSRIGRDLSSLGLEIVKKELVNNKYTCPLHWFDTGNRSRDDSDSVE
jgi:Lrp/AsnC family leucine-responsive transcriptional regulator